MTASTTVNPLSDPDNHIHSGLWTNGFNYKGTSNFVIIPTFVSLISGTSIHVYSSHLGLDATHWIEAGIGRWASNGNDLTLFTYDGYYGTYNFLTVPNFNQRSIQIVLQVSSNGVGTMYVYDTYSGNSINMADYGITVSTYMVDMNEEEASATRVYSGSSTAYHHGSQIQLSNYSWHYWDNTIPSYSAQALPLHAQEHDLYTYLEVDTWCTP